MGDQRHRNLTAALGFLQLAPRAPELRLLHRWLDSWTGLGLIAVGVERQGLRLSLSHIAENEWRAMFMGDPLISARGFGVAATPWRAAQRAAWATVGLDAAGGSVSRDDCRGQRTRADVDSAMMSCGSCRSRPSFGHPTRVSRAEVVQFAARFVRAVENL